MTADTNPRPCGICGNSCGWTTNGSGYHQCAVFGKLWSDDSPTGPKFIAQLLGIERASVDRIIARGRFVPPGWPVEETGRPLYRRGDVLRWAKSTGRL